MKIVYIIIKLQVSLAGKFQHINIIIKYVLMLVCFASDDK